jgi:hypothetical protein
MKFKEILNKFLVTLGYAFIAVLSGVIGFLFLRRKKVNYEDKKPGDIINSLPNSDAVRRRIADFGTATGNSKRRKSNDAGAGGGVHDNSAGTGDSDILTGWVESAERMGVSGTHPILRIRNSGSTQGTDESS